MEILHVEADRVPEARDAKKTALEDKKKKKKRPRAHYVLMGICGVLIAAIWPDQAAGLIGYLRTSQWVSGETYFNAVTLSGMAWNVFIWTPAAIYLLWVMWKKHYYVRRIGLGVFGAQLCFSFQRIVFAQYLMVQEVWPEEYYASPTAVSIFWFVAFLASFYGFTYIWKHADTFSRG